MEGEEYLGVEPAKLLRKRAAETINNLVCLGSGERPSFLMRERMRWLVAVGMSGLSPRRPFTVQFDDRKEKVAELVKCLEESNRQHDKALLYILLGRWIYALETHLEGLFLPRLPRMVSSIVDEDDIQCAMARFLQDKLERAISKVLQNKLQCVKRQRALLSCFHAFDAGVEDWRIFFSFRRVETATGQSTQSILFDHGEFFRTIAVGEIREIYLTRN